MSTNTLASTLHGSVMRGVFGYCFLVLIARLAGKRPGKQISPPVSY